MSPSDPPLSSPSGHGSFDCEACVPDTVNHATFVRDLYEMAKDKTGVRTVTGCDWGQQQPNRLMVATALPSLGSYISFVRDQRLIATAQLLSGEARPARSSSQHQVVPKCGSLSPPCKQQLHCAAYLLFLHQPVTITCSCATRRSLSRPSRPLSHPPAPLHSTAGKYSVPVLWDKKHKTIVNNESSEIIR